MTIPSFCLQSLIENSLFRQLALVDKQKQRFDISRRR